MSSTIKVLIVDEDISCRDTLRLALAENRDITVIGTTPTGKLGRQRVKQFQPDLIIVAAELSDVGASEFARGVLSDFPHTGVLIASRNDPRSADLTIEALEAGAFDFVLKPDGRCQDEHVAILRRMLLPKIRCFSIKRYSRIAKSLSLEKRSNEEELSAEKRELAIAENTLRKKLMGMSRGGRPESVLIGASTGGPEALSELIPALPASLPVPVVIVLHMPKMFTGRMAQALDRTAAVTVKEAEDGDTLQPGHVYLAPGGQHLIVERGTQRRIVLRTTDGPPENGCKPSVDVLFRSAAPVLKNRALAVILTGMGEDGTKGLIELKKHNVPVLVQNEATSVVWGMPGSAVRAQCADAVLPLGRIAQRIVEIVTESAG